MKQNLILRVIFYVSKAVYDSVLGPSVKTDGNSNLGLKPFFKKMA